MLLGLCIGVRGQTTYRYWIDQNESAAKQSTSNVQSWTNNIDISSLAPNSGLHALHIQAKRDGKWGPVATSYFFLSDLPTIPTWGTPQRGKLWLDSDVANAQSVESISGVVNVDISSLPAGLHSLHYCTVNAEGTASPVATSYFFLSTPPTIPTWGTPKRGKLWLDNDIANAKNVENMSGAVNVDISSLSAGLHSLHYCTVNAKGTASPAKTSYFFLSTPPTIPTWGTPQRGRLWWDSDIENATTFATTGGVVNVDIGNLSVGLHALHVCTVNQSGTSSPAATAYYFKTNEHQLSHYTFWVNDYLEGATTVKFNRPLQPFSVVEMLPVTMRPIRSTSFLVEPAGSRMMVYAVNDVTVQLFDTKGKCTEATGKFVDERVSQDITNVVQLVTEVRYTSTAPAEGGINWHRVAAEEGDRLRFRTDRACTMQLFSPSGEEVLSVSGTAAKQYNGVDATTDGYYYLAIHDITDNTGETISVDYLSSDSHTSRTIQMADLLMPFCCPFDLDFTEVSGLKAYILPTYDPQSEDLWAVRMDYVPGGTGILLKAAKAGEYKVPYTETSLYCLNLLRGTTEQTTISATDGSMSNYFFTGDEETALFARVTSTKDVPAGSAYLQIPAQVVGGRQQLRVNFEDRADGVDAPIAPAPQQEGWYTLDGQRLDNAPTRSGIYIKDGRKVVIK